MIPYFRCLVWYRVSLWYRLEFLQSGSTPFFNTKKPLPEDIQLLFLILFAVNRNFKKNIAIHFVSCNTFFETRRKNSCTSIPLKSSAENPDCFSLRSISVQPFFVPPVPINLPDSGNVPFFIPPFGESGKNNSLALLARLIVFSLFTGSALCEVQSNFTQPVRCTPYACRLFVTLTPCVKIGRKRM